MIDYLRVQESKDRIVDNVLIVGINEVKGYTTKKYLKEQMSLLMGVER